MLICAALVMTSQAADYMLTGYLPTYLKVVVRVGHTAGLVMITATLAILMALLVFVAALSDRIGVKPIMWTGSVLLVVASIPAFLLIRSGGSNALIFLGVLLIGLMELCFDSTAPAALPALFPTRVRYGALAIAYNISISAVGGTTPLIAQALISATGNAMVPAFMLMVAGVDRHRHAVLHARGRRQAAAWVGPGGGKRRNRTRHGRRCRLGSGLKAPQGLAAPGGDRLSDLVGFRPPGLGAAVQPDLVDQPEQRRHWRCTATPAPAAGPRCRRTRRPGSPRRRCPGSRPTRVASA